MRDRKPGNICRKIIISDCLLFSNLIYGRTHGTKLLGFDKISSVRLRCIDKARAINLDRGPLCEGHV